MNKKPPTAWIQNLNKTQIIEELRTRGIPFKESESYNDFRERLRENIKSLNCTQEEGHMSDGVVSPDNSQENIAGTDCDSDEDIMSTSCKIEFNLTDGDWEIFTEKMECYFTTKSITDDKMKVATLVTKLSDDAHALLIQLIFPR
ncbi:hypothetical protein QAD02_013337 [Eretmocerus hayati]|uniref:Uncharacterized protein n=1 Tax=Eretmocerus hayati TaxID=131215 RepID=A0ACC2P6Y1_9HYME|nr:hypothetical protein QAD02_013337 [Eretmocerus hayati]